MHQSPVTHHHLPVFQNWPVVVDSEVDSSQKEVVDSVLVNTGAWCTVGSLRSLVDKFKMIILFDKIVHAMITAASKIIELEIKQIASFTIEELTMHPAWLFSLLCFFTLAGSTKHLVFGLIGIFLKFLVFGCLLDPVLWHRHLKYQKKILHRPWYLLEHSQTFLLYVNSASR